MSKQLTVFYSWQSDTPSSDNRSYIEKAIRKALEQLKSNAALESALRDATVELDKDTQGVAGSPPITDTILRKIEECAVFVADLTFVGESKAILLRESEDARQFPNPNVLIEYGYALRCHSHAKLIGIMNTAYGHPDTGSLPFNLRHRRHPITYSSKANKKAEFQKLADTLTGAIGLILAQHSSPIAVGEEFIPQSLIDKISAFRLDRLGKIVAGETPVPLESVPKLVLHLLPVSAFSESGNVDLKAVETKFNSLKPMGEPRTWGPPQFSFNGLSHSGGNGASTFSYIHLFRSGALEAVSARIASDKLVFGDRFEGDLHGARAYIDFQKGIGIGPPLFVAVSIMSAKGFKIYPRQPTGWDHSPHVKPIEQDDLVVPEVLMRDGKLDILRLIRPALDAIWQASGWPGSPGYDASGEWVGYLHWNR